MVTARNFNQAKKVTTLYDKCEAKAKSCGDVGHSSFIFYIQHLLGQVPVDPTVHLPAHIISRILRRCPDLWPEDLHKRAEFNGGLKHKKELDWLQADSGVKIAPFHIFHVIRIANEYLDNR